VKRDGLTAALAVSMEPPLPIYFFQMLANLKDRSAKSFPAKKVCTCFFFTLEWSLILLSAAACYVEIGARLSWWAD
jgi:hypothetical protein